MSSSPNDSLTTQEKLFVGLQHVLPKQAITQLAGWIASQPGGSFTHRLIRWFVAKYGVDMSEAADPTIESYSTFNLFFTRALREGVRPRAQATWLCPVDGAISQFGRLDKDRVFQAKGHSYSTLTLVGGSPALSSQFDEGSFATLYLSPRDYHRIHMPCAGELREMIYVPGDLYSVNPATAKAIPGLFARNERTVCVFDSDHGPFVLTLVGATIVGSMSTAWHGVVNPPRHRDIQRWQYAPGAVSLKQGDEMGRFLLGSTVVMLFPKNTMRFNPAWTAGGSIRLNQEMAQA